MKVAANLLGKCPWALKHNSRFWPAWALTQNQNSTCLYRTCYIDPLKWGTWALTQEWALAQDNTVIPLDCGKKLFPIIMAIQIGWPDFEIMK